MPLPISTINGGGCRPNIENEEEASHAALSAPVASQLEANRLEAALTTNHKLHCANQNGSFATLHPSIASSSMNSPQPMTSKGMQETLHPPQLTITMGSGPRQPDVLKCQIKSCKKLNVKTHPLMVCSCK